MPPPNVPNLNEIIENDIVLDIFDTLKKTKEHINKIAYYEETTLDVYFSSAEENSFYSNEKLPFSLLIRLTGSELDPESESLWYPNILNHPSILPEQLQFFHKESQKSIIWLCENFTAGRQTIFDHITEYNEVVSLLSFLDIKENAFLPQGNEVPLDTNKEFLSSEEKTSYLATQSNIPSHLLEELPIEEFIAELISEYKSLIKLTGTQNNSYLNLLETYRALSSQRNLTLEVPLAEELLNKIAIRKINYIKKI